MSQTYSDVDSSSDPSGAVAWQESMATWPSVARYKQQTYHLLTEARCTRHRLRTGRRPRRVGERTFSWRRPVGEDVLGGGTSWVDRRLR